jgi:hypothetical protein
VTLQEPQNPSIADIDMPDTEVIVLAHPSPVFVDSTGRRRRMLRKVAYGFGALCIVYGGLVSVSLAGGPVSSSAVLPLPDRADDNNEEGVVVARPSPTPEPVATRAAVQPILEVFPTRGAPVIRPRAARAVTPRTTGARRSPAPSAKPTSVSAKPVESTATKQPTSSSTPPSTGSTTPVGPQPPVAPQPPVPSTGGGSGGQGGGGAVDEPSDAPATRAPVEPRPPAVTDPAEPEPAAEPAGPVGSTEPPAEPEPEAGDGDAP